MAITSIGYPGLVGATNIDWSVLQQGLGAEYWCNNIGGVQVSPKTDGTRQVHITNGYFGGQGIVDLTPGADLTLPVVSSGTKWFMIVARRNWNTEETTFAVIDAGSTTPAVLPDRETDAQTAGGSGMDDQPLALVPLKAGDTVPGTPIDIRAFGGTSRGVMTAYDERVMQYLNEYGTMVWIGDDLWTRRGDGWRKDKEIIVCGPNYGNALGFGGTSGWTTVSKLLSYARRSRVSGFHQVRLTAGRSGSSLSFGTSNGGIGDFTVANITNREYWPPYQLSKSGIYRQGSSTFTCGAIFNPDGSIGIVDGKPGTQITKRSVSDSEDWSFRVNFEWESA